MFSPHVSSQCTLLIFPNGLPSICIGIRVHDTLVRILLYADDGALVAESPQDLQRMLDALREYCGLWRLHVNVKKTKVVVFNPNKSHGCSEFTYDGQQRVKLDDFKYLGVMFHATRRRAATIEHRVSQGKRLLAAWVRRCQMWSMKPAMASQMFRTCVMPALEYSVGLWGAGNFQSVAWQAVETFWRGAARTILGAPLRTPSEAVLGDLGWTHMWVTGAWQAVCLWTRVTCMNDDALARKAMHVQRDMFAQKQKCWLADLHSTLHATDYGRVI